MIHLEANSANELFIKISQNLLDNGIINNPRNLKTLELNNVFLTLNYPKHNIVTLPARDINYKYLNAELDWYMNGSYDVEEIGKHSKFWYKLSDKDNKVNSNYGQIIFRELINNKSQFDWCVDKLKEDINTRQAILNYNQPHHKKENNNDFPCTIAQLFRYNYITNSLDSTVFMRSNDLIYGLTYDLPWFTWVQQQICDKLNIKCGVYHHFAASLHVYEKHFKMIENISNSEVI